MTPEKPIPPEDGSGDGDAGTERCRDCPGFPCRGCGCRHLPVYYTRRANGYTMRVRMCRRCGRRLVTREMEL